MAQVTEGDIKLGSTRVVGHIQIDSGMIRAEAGPLEPRLVVPIKIDMSNRPADEMLVLTRLVGYLHIDNANNPATQVGLPAHLDLIPGMYARSLPEGRSRHETELRFQLGPEAANRLEAARHQSAEQIFTLHMRCTGSVAWVRKTWGEMRPARSNAGSADEADPFQLKFGMHSDLSFFWTVEIDSLRIQIEPSAWITNVLPGLGVDAMRLVEVSFPPSLPGTAGAAKAFDEALQALNARRYDECVSKCRGIVTAWNKKLGATKTTPLASVVASKLGWAADDPRVIWLDRLWQALVDMSNVPHHPETRKAGHQLSPQDARLHLMLTAILSEYLYALEI